MAARADVEGHLHHREAEITTALREWCRPDLSDGDRAGVVATYLDDAGFDDVATLAEGRAVTAHRSRAAKGAPTVLVIGSHDISDVAPAETVAHRPFDPAVLRGPGVGSTFGPFVAFAEGFKAALGDGRDDPVNIRFLSVGSGSDPASGLAATTTDDVDAIIFTNAISWDPAHPTITTGARGRVQMKITISAGKVVNDAAFAGAIRNPLNKLVEILAQLRDERGRIAIPDFYERAEPPSPAVRSSLTASGFDPDSWIVGLDVRRPQGSLSALERATMWPVVSVTQIGTPQSTSTSTPASASATVCTYLVPDQRPVEVEAALASWVRQQVPSNLTVMLKVLSTARPYRSSPDQLVVAAQARAASRLHGRPALLVPGGGAFGAGEVHFATGAPIGFAGICGPRHGFGSAAEIVPRSLVGIGIAHAAETCLQLPRRTPLRSTS